MFDYCHLCCTVKFFSLFLDLTSLRILKDFSSNAITLAKSFAGAYYSTHSILLMIRPASTYHHLQYHFVIISNYFLYNLKMLQDIAFQEIEDNRHLDCISWGGLGVVISPNAVILFGKFCNIFAKCLLCFVVLGLLF